MTVQSYKELIAWQKAMDLVVEVVEVYKATATFPSDERFGLTNQLRARFSVHDCQLTTNN
jgi:four helix bundle protein